MKKDGKKTSMQQIADRLSISKNAVSLALNGKPGVSEETRELILQMARKLNYPGPASGKAIADKILILVPAYIRNDHFFYHDIYWAAEVKAGQKGYTTLLATVTEDMQRQLQLPALYHEMNWAGVILVGTLDVDYVAHLMSIEPNLISVDQYYCGLDLSSLVTANLEGAYQMTEFAISQGHKDIGFVGSLRKTSSIYERYCGYQLSMISHSYPINPDRCIFDDSPLDTLLSDPDVLRRALTNMEKLPSAWICSGDRMAIAMMQALTQIGLAVPHDVSIFGFDDLELSSMVTPPLTTMHVDRRAMGKRAVELLLAHQDPKTGHSKHALPTRLVVRGSHRSIL